MSKVWNEDPQPEFESLSVLVIETVPNPTSPDPDKVTELLAPYELPVTSLPVFPPVST